MIYDSTTSLGVSFGPYILKIPCQHHIYISCALKLFPDDTSLISVHEDRAKLKQILFSDRSSLLRWLKKCMYVLTNPKHISLFFSIINSANQHLKHFMIKYAEIGLAWFANYLDLIIDFNVEFKDKIWCRIFI